MSWKCLNEFNLFGHSLSKALRDCHLCFTQGISKGKLPRSYTVSEVGLQHWALPAPAWLLLQAQLWGAAVPCSSSTGVPAPSPGWLWWSTARAPDPGTLTCTHNLRKNKDRYGFFFFFPRGSGNGNWNEKVVGKIFFIIHWGWTAYNWTNVVSSEFSGKFFC